MTGGAGANEDTCVEGTNCDTFKLTVSGTEEDWAGKVVNINITWLTPANDYDLYIHKGESCPATGPCQGPIVSQDGNGAPSTQEVGSIDPSSTGTGVYLVRLVIFSVTPGDAYTGTASVGPEPPGRKANYVKAGITFSPNVTVKAPVSRRNGDGFKTFLRHSIDGGRTWSNRVRVSDGLNTRTTLFPWLETGPTQGSVGIVWYGTSNPVNSDDANWHVFYAQSFNADEEVPTFRQATASDHFIHASNISTGGTLGTANRNLIDYFQVSFDPTGAAIISYTDDHNDYDGHTYVTRQISGASINNEGTTNVPAPVEGVSLPPRAVSAADAPQVTDFAQDIQVGLLAVLPLNDPLDILSVRYSCETTLGGPVIVARMKVSDLTLVPPGAAWRMNFAANAPDSRLSATGDYSFGVADRGDQFFMRAQTPLTITTEPFLSGSQFTFGTVQRLSDGTLAYTTRGAADSGSFDLLSKTITVKVSASKLNPFVSKGPPIGVGSVLTGLRGQTFTIGTNAKTDITRGGTLFTMSNCQAGGGGGGGGGTNHGHAFRVTGSGKILGKTVSFEINADDLPSGRLKYHDKEQEIDFASDRITSFTRLATNKITFSGEATINGQKVMFTVEVEDNGAGTSDRFKITITGVVNSMREGTLTQGNIQFHK